MREKLLTMRIDKDFLDKVDSVSRELNFPNRASFIRHALEETMEKYVLINKSMIVIDEDFFRHLMRVAVSQTVNKAVENYRANLKEYLTKMVFDTTSKILAEKGELIQ